MSRNFVKEVEKYFLERLGSGVMLSARDYVLIKNWEDKGADIETIKRGISLAFQNSKANIRSVYQCRHFVENLLAGKDIGIEEKEREEEKREKNFHYEKQIARLKRVIKKIDSLLKEEKKKEIKQVYSFYKTELSKLLCENKRDMFERLEEMESRFYEDFFNALDKNLALIIGKEARSLMPFNASFISKEVEEDSFKVLRNEVVKKKFGIPDFFGFEDD